MAWYFENLSKLLISTYCCLPTCLSITLMQQWEHIMSRRKTCFFATSAPQSVRNEERPGAPSLTYLSLFLLYFSISFSPPTSIISPHKAVHPSKAFHHLAGFLGPLSSLLSSPLLEGIACMDHALVWLCFSNAYKLLHLFLGYIKGIPLEVNKMSHFNEKVRLIGPFDISDYLHWYSSIRDYWLTRLTWAAFYLK